MSAASPYETALVTGATRGIGAAIVEKLSAAHIRLFLLGRDGDALSKLAGDIRDAGGAADYLAGDLLDNDYLDAAVATARDSLGNVDVLINNAGMSVSSAIQDADLDEWQRIMDLNYSAVVRLTHALVPGMIEHRRGAIVNISSISGRNTTAKNAAYTAAKHALNGFTGCLYEDVRDYGIKVTSIMPGFVQTDLTSRFRLQHDNMIQPADVADAVVYVLGSSPSCCPTEIVIRPQARP